MEAASQTVPIEYMKGADMDLIVDPAENISTDSSCEEKVTGSTGAVGYTVDTAKVEVPDITGAGSQEDWSPWEAHPDNRQREKELKSAFVGCDSWEEMDLKGSVSEHASEEPDPETGQQLGKEKTNLEIGSAQADKDGAHGHRSNGVLAVYYVNKSPVIQLLEACDRDIQPGLFLCPEDTTETVTWSNSLSGNSSSTPMGKRQFDTRFNCSKDFNQLQELEEIPGEVSDPHTDQVPIQQVVRRQRENRRRNTVPTARIVIPRLSSEEIRINVYSSFQEILMNRLQETDDLNISEDAVQAIAADIEKELFMLFYCTNTRYKNKYRSLMFNLKDVRNTHLFRQVLLGEITPQYLVLMSSTELASLELMEWRERENKHNIKLITTESDEFERQPLIKLTHKGEIEIERDTDQNLTLEDLMDSSPKSAENGESSESEISRAVDTTYQHRSHLLDPNCQICTAERKIGVFCKERRIHNASFTLKQLLPQTHAVWKGFIQTSNMKRFLVKAYPVLGYMDLLTKVLSSIITVGRCVLPEAIWDSVDKLRSSGTKEICLVRFKPATKGDLWPYNLYYSYLNSRQRYGTVVLEQRSPKSMYLIPLPALQKVPSRLPPLSGPGLESSHPDLLLALAFSKKQCSAGAFRKSHECRRGCSQENKSRQKCVEEIDKEHLSGHSQLSPFLAKPGGQPYILPMLPTFTQPRELFHHSCQINPSDLLLGDLLSSEEQFSYTDLSSNFVDEMLQSLYREEQEPDGIGNVVGPSAFTGEWANDGQDLDTNEQQHHGDDTGKENQSRARSERSNMDSNLLTQFKPADVLPENFLLSVTQLNSLLQEEDESHKESGRPTNEQEADGDASTQYREHMKTYIKELDKLFTKVPLGTLSHHEDCSHLCSTISCCAGVLHDLLSASDSSLACEAQIPAYLHESQNNTTASQEGPRHTIRPGSPLPLPTLQLPNNAQHLGHCGTMTLDPGVLPHVLPAIAVTMQQAEVPFQNGARHLFPFRFNSREPSHRQRGIDAESLQLQGEHLLSPYCPTQHHHCSSLHMDIGQGPTTFSGAPSSCSDGAL